jgi:hypothetical protein
MILLVHSCDHRSWLWEHWWKYFRLSGWKIQVRFIKGKKEFSDQLYEVLTDIKDEYVWHTLDDYFIRFPIDFDYYWKLAHELKADAVRMQPNVQFNSLPYRFEWTETLLKQRPDSDYLISTHTSIWRREYFLDCLVPGLDPWDLEKHRPECFGDVYFAPQLPFWYIDAVLKQVVTDMGKQMMDAT